MQLCRDGAIDKTETEKGIWSSILGVMSSQVSMVVKNVCSDDQ